MPRTAGVPPASCLDCPLRALELFSSLDKETVQLIQAARTGTRRYFHGTMIYMVGDPVQEAFNMFDGYAITYRLLDNGARQVLRFILPGDLLFVQSYEDAAWTDSAEVVDHAVVCALSAAGLQRLFERRIEISHALVRIHQMEERLLEEHITDLGRRPAVERVARLFLELFHRERLRGRIVENSCFLPFTQEQIGDAVGLSPVHVSRVHSELQAMRAMSVKRRWLTISDFDGAAHRFDYDFSHIKQRPLI